MLYAEFASPEFDEFLDLIGSRVQLKGFERYRGGLDIKSKSFICCLFALHLVSLSTISARYYVTLFDWHKLVILCELG